MKGAGGGSRDGTLAQWLLSEQPQSRRQAALGRLYHGWRTFSRNRLALVGLAIVLVLNRGRGARRRAGAVSAGGR